MAQRMGHSIRCAILEEKWYRKWQKRHFLSLRRSEKGDIVIHWGIIGKSDISRKRGAPAILARPEERLLLSICSRDMARAVQFASEHGDGRFDGTRAFDNLQAFLADPELQAVY